MTRSGHRSCNCFGLALFAGCFLVLSGCASMSVDECHTADWYDVGRKDGRAGRDSGHQLGRHNKACAEANIKPDLLAYRQGHAAGLRDYCVPRKAFKLGYAGSAGIPDVCPADTIDLMLPAARLGEELHQVETDMEYLDNETQGHFAALEDSEISDRERQVAEQEIARLQREIGVLEVIAADLAARARAEGWH